MLRLLLVTLRLPVQILETVSLLMELQLHTFTTPDPTWWWEPCALGHTLINNDLL